MRKLWLAAALVATMLTTAGSVQAAGKPTAKKIPAVVRVESKDLPGGGCSTGAWLEFPDVRGATSYAITYYDTYWKRDIPASGPPFADAAVGSNAGTHALGLAGGAASLPCGDPGEAKAVKDTEAWYRSRFHVKKAFAYFPGKPPKPKPRIFVTVDLPGAGGVPVGASVQAKVTVTAGEVAFKSVSLGRGLTGGGDVADVTSRPGGLSGFSLGAYGSKTFTFTVKAKQAGAAALAAKATGTTKKGSASGSGAATLRVAKAALAITIATTPSPVTLDVSDDGKIAKKKLTVTVKLTNTSTTKIDGVSLQTLNPEPRTKGQRLDQIAVDKGSLPWNVGTIQPKAVATRTFGLEVTGDGKYQIRSLALFASPGAPGGNGRATAIGGKFEVIVPALYFRATLEDENVFTQGGAQWIKSGKTFFVSGVVKNLSSWKQLCLRPLYAKKAGNVNVKGPVDIAVYGRDVETPPLAGGLKPGENVVWGLWADTGRIGGTRATVSFDPGAAEMKSSSSCAVEKVIVLKPIPDSQIKIAKGKKEFVVHVDTRDVQFPPLSGWGRAWNFFGGVAIAPGIALGQWLQDTVTAAQEYVAEHTTPEAIAYQMVTINPVIQAGQVWTTAYRNLNTAASVYSDYWKTASAEEKHSFIAHLQSVLRRSRDDAWKGASEDIGAVFQGWMDNVEAATAHGDNPEVWQALGTTTGKGVSRFVIDYAIGELGVRIAARTPAMARTFARIGDESVTYRKLRGMPAGKLVNVTELRELWGFAASDIKAFRQIAAEEGIVIGIRGRSPVSVKNLEEGAVYKHEAVKPKNVNEIDIRFLNFDRADDGLVAFKRYSQPEKDQILARIQRAGLSPEQLEEVMARLDTRFGEADKYLGSLQTASQEGVIDIGFNYTENGVGRPTSQKPRKFKLLAEQEAGGTTTYRPIQQNTLIKKGQKLPKWCQRALSAVLCRLTGDMDGVYLATAQNGPLPMKQLLRVYKKLEAAGWQHPETFTWVRDMGTEFWFEAKEKILKGVGAGGEAMAEFGPDGAIRSTYINLKRSKLLSKGSGAWFADVVGGYAMMR